MKKKQPRLGIKKCGDVQGSSDYSCITLRAMIQGLCVNEDDTKTQRPTGQSLGLVRLYSFPYEGFIAKEGFLS